MSQSRNEANLQHQEHHRGGTVLFVRRRPAVAFLLLRIKCCHDGRVRHDDHAHDLHWLLHVHAPARRSADAQNVASRRRDVHVYVFSSMDAISSRYTVFHIHCHLLCMHDARQSSEQPLRRSVRIPRWCTTTLAQTGPIWELRCTDRRQQQRRKRIDAQHSTDLNIYIS